MIPIGKESCDAKLQGFLLYIQLIAAIKLRNDLFLEISSNMFYTKFTVIRG